MPMLQRFELYTIDTLKLTWEPPLDSTVSYPKTLSISYLCLAHYTWARWWRSWSPQVGTPFLIALCSVKTHRLLPHTPLWEIIFTWPLSPKGWQAPSMWSLQDALLGLALINLYLYFSLHKDDVLKVNMNVHPILIFKTYLHYAQHYHDHSSDNTLNLLVIT